MVRSRSTRIGDGVIIFICILVILVCLLPLLNILARSLSEPAAVMRSQVGLWPKGFNLQAYKLVLADAQYTQSIMWTAVLTIFYTMLSITMTVLCAYPLIYDQLKGRRFFNTIILFTMYFNAGMIPNYLLYKSLGLLDNPWVLVLPNCLSVFNMIIMRSFFYGIPESLRESADIDGAGPIRILLHIYLPLSTAVIASLSLFYAVGRWNGYSDALYFLINARKYHPIQLHLYNILNSIANIDVALTEGGTVPGLSDSLKMATVMFATVPILIVYPFLQKYFITGVTLGAVKG